MNPAEIDLWTILWIALGLGCGLLIALIGFTALIAAKIERALPAKGRFLEVAGQRLHVTEVGEGQPIVMIHGLGGQTGNFTYSLADLLAKTHRVVMIDRPGSGHSPRRPGSAAGIRAQADLMAKAIGQMGFDRPLVVGHSLGGAIALALALDHPESVGALALVAPLTQPQDQVPGPFRGLTVRAEMARTLIGWTLAAPMSIARRVETMDALFGPDAAPADFATRGGGLLSLRPKAFRAASQDLVAASDDLPGMVERYPGLSLPVSVLYGIGDRILAAEVHGRGLANSVPGARLTLIEGGHMLPISAAEATADFILNAAAELSDATGSTPSDAPEAPMAVQVAQTH